MGSSYSQKEIDQEVKDAGSWLVMPPSSIHELLNLLDKVEILLAKVEQVPSKSTKEALLPLMKALIANELLRHKNIDVKVSLISCISEIIRIMEPDEPYKGETMKEIFQLTVMALEKLSHSSGRCYTKALSILESFAKFRWCLVMLDLECDELIVKMFHHFLTSIRSDHPHVVFSDMETIMTLVVNESDEISLGLLCPLLYSSKKENQNRSPLSWKLAEKVMKSCSSKLKPYLREAVDSMGIAFNEYSEVVASICQDALNETKVDKALVDDAVSLGELGTMNGSSEPVMNDGISLMRSDDVRDCNDARIEVEIVPKKRRWKVNFLAKPEEGYDLSWASRRKSLRQPRRIEGESLAPKTEEVSQSTDVSLKKEPEKRRDFNAKYERGSSKIKLNDAVSNDPRGKQVSSAQQMDNKKRSRGKTVSEKHVNEESGDERKVSFSVTNSLAKVECHMDETTWRTWKRKRTPRKRKDPELPQGVKKYGEELVGYKINVWWPMDQKFYEGIIDSYDPLLRKHKVLYADGDEELLTLSIERWKLIGIDSSPDQMSVLDHPHSKFQLFFVLVLIYAAAHLSTGTLNLSFKS